MGAKVTRQALVTALISCPTIKEAAAQIGISKQTAQRWLKDPAFTDELRKAQDAATRQAMQRVIRSVSSAVDVLEEVMKDADNAPGARVQAAKTILEQAIKTYDQEQIQRRLDELERRLGENG